MDRYADAVRQALSVEGDSLTYNRLISKLDSAFVEEKEPEMLIKHGTIRPQSWHERAISMQSIGSDNSESI